MDSADKTRRNLMVVSTTVLAMAFLDAKLKSTTFIQFEITNESWKVWVSALLALMYLFLRFWASPERKPGFRGWADENSAALGQAMSDKLFAISADQLVEKGKNLWFSLSSIAVNNEAQVEDIYDAVEFSNHAQEPAIPARYFTKALVCPSEWGVWHGCATHAHSNPVPKKEYTSGLHIYHPPELTDIQGGIWHASNPMKVSATMTVLWRHPQSCWLLLEHYAPFAIGIIAMVVSLAKSIGLFCT